jgi:hypothetical protein
MEEEFHPKGWLGIIKGSNLHIDFSSPDNFDQSFEQLIRQINFIEQKLALQPRKFYSNNLHRPYIHVNSNRCK